LPLSLTKYAKCTSVIYKNRCFLYCDYEHTAPCGPPVFRDSSIETINLLHWLNLRWPLM
jgi:hypothetical protein